MKNKYIIIILFFVIILTGCSTIEIEEYAIIAGIGIDYRENKYIVTYEIYKDDQGDVTSISSITTTGEGKDVGGAIISTEAKIEQKSYLNHCRIIILSESIIDKQLNDVISFLIHDPRMRSLEYIVISKDLTPKEILEKPKKEQVLSLQIYKDIQKDKGTAGIYSECRFVSIVNAIENKRRTVVIPTITYDDMIIFNGAKLFNDCTLKKEIDKNEVLYIQLLDNILQEGLTEVKEKSIFIKSFRCNKKYKKNIMNITLYFSLLAYDNINYDLSNIYDQEQLINDFNKEIKEKIMNILKEYQTNQIDPFGILDYIYYFHPFSYKKQNDIFDFYKKLEFQINVNTHIITTGFTEESME